MLRAKSTFTSFFSVTSYRHGVEREVGYPIRPKNPSLHLDCRVIIIGMVWRGRLDIQSVTNNPSLHLDCRVINVGVLISHLASFHEDRWHHEPTASSLCINFSNCSREYIGRVLLHLWGCWNVFRRFLTLEEKRLVCCKRAEQHMCSGDGFSIW
ncbi:hypothetical protein AVEN_31328-1 [Araneus ventricosus]|uniref:Uncharacterized protein n=1 Tax=Araneus ventricosus TaxID=182803 RepID=A0A4Y2S9U3_ARAVE|nr:hypothetical protein AVEN_31328-1 [Araneus ventricosus]